MKKQVSSTDDILAKLASVSKSVRNKTARRVADGERIVFAERNLVIDSDAKVLKNLGHDAGVGHASAVTRKRAAWAWCPQ
jgi:hypothetical protein